MATAPSVVAIYKFSYNVKKIIGLRPFGRATTIFVFLENVLLSEIFDVVYI
jgi:hypothetical protein